EHYCERHEGIVIGFDASNPIVHKMKAVKYVSERVIFDATWNETYPGLDAFEDELAFSKNDEWRYESEYRQLFTLADVNKKAGDKGKIFLFLKLPADSIVSVLIGSRSSPDFESKVRTVLKRPHFAHVELRRAVLHDSKFELSLNRT